MAEIKISELSIGDWVRHTFYEENLQIKRIDGESERLLVEKGLMSVSCHLDHFEPIPLTPEILEKNGFRKLDRFNEYVIGEWDSNPFIAVRLAEKMVEPTILVKNEGTSAHLFGPLGENVHQLQHVLRLAGVEKEIEV